MFGVEDEVAKGADGGSKGIRIGLVELAWEMVE